MNRNSRPDVFCEKGVLRNFAKFTGKHLCPNLIFNKVAGGKNGGRLHFIYLAFLFRSTQIITKNKISEELVYLKNI